MTELITVIARSVNSEYLTQNPRPNRASVLPASTMMACVDVDERARSNDRSTKVDIAAM
jgi:hypothetical protein